MKFNHAWLNANDYKDLVKGFWSPLSDSFEGSFMSQFARNIYTDSQATKEWAKEYNKKLKKDICKIEDRLGEIIIGGNSGLEIESTNAKLKLLLQKKQDFLAYEEAKWCL